MNTLSQSHLQYFTTRININNQVCTTFTWMLKIDQKITQTYPLASVHQLYG